MDLSQFYGNLKNEQAKAKFIKQEALQSVRKATLFKI
jgi:hypothetical protein